MDNKRLFDLLEHVNNNFQKPDLFSAKVQGEWQPLSTKEFYHPFANP